MERYKDTSVPRWWGKHKKEEEERVRETAEKNYFKDPPWALLKKLSAKKQAEEELQELDHLRTNKMFPVDRDENKYSEEGYKLNKKYWKKK